MNGKLPLVLKTLLLAAPPALLLTSAATANNPPVAVGDMDLYCQGEASAKFGVRPQDIMTQPPYEHKNGAHSVFGQFPTQGENVTIFECRFSPKNHFHFVKKTRGGDEQAAEQKSSEPTAGDQAAQVQFPPGSSGTTLEGAIRGRDYFDYGLRAKAGQTMSVDLKVDGTNGDGTIYFNILPPGSTGEAVYVGSRDGNSAKVHLAESGIYVIRLYLMGNDRDSDKTVGYDLKVAIH